MEHSKNAMKKTVASFVCLAMMLVVSFIVSEYEYTHIDKQVEGALNSNVIQHAFYNNHSIQNQAAIETPAQKMIKTVQNRTNHTDNKPHDANEKIIHLQNVHKSTMTKPTDNQIDLNKIIQTSTEGISAAVSIASQVDW